MVNIQGRCPEGKDALFMDFLGISWNLKVGTWKAFSQRFKNSVCDCTEKSSPPQHSFPYKSFSSQLYVATKLAIVATGLVVLLTIDYLRFGYWDIKSGSVWLPQLFSVYESSK